LLNVKGSDDAVWHPEVPGSVPDATRVFFLEVVGLERGPLSLVSTNEELLGRKSSGYGLESREYGRRDPSRLLRFTLYAQKLAVTSPTSGSLSICIVRSRTQATGFVLVCLYLEHVSVYQWVILIVFYWQHACGYVGSEAESETYRREYGCSDVQTRFSESIAIY
jgi:hypothetical protein